MTWQPEPRQLTAQRAIDRARALTVKCPYCYAEPGDECFDPRTGVVLVKQPAHLRRLLAIYQDQEG